MVWTIYRILLPDMTPVYVGQASGMPKRAAKHVRNAHKRPNVDMWNIRTFLVELAESGVYPLFQVVAVAHSEEEALELETEWVRRTVEAGFPVLNRWRVHREIVGAKFGKRDLRRYFAELVERSTKSAA